MFAGSINAFTGFFFSDSNYGGIKEIQEALFSIASKKAPRSNGFSSHFFKNASFVVRSDVVEAIKNFFTTGKS